MSTVRFWGVRGSMAAPGKQTYRYGGNTSCVSVDRGSTILILDAGSGVRDLGRWILDEQRFDRIVIALSHLHFDHVRGFPLFAPLYEAASEVFLLGYPLDGALWYPTALMDGVHFPRLPDDLPSTLHQAPVGADEVLGDTGLRLIRRRINHPGDAYGFRVDTPGGSLVHVPDNEIDPPGGGAVSFDELAAFCRGAAILSHDAQYRPAEMEERAGWGHSSVDRVCDLAEAATVGRLILFHHDPARTDDEVDDMVQDARVRLDPVGIPVDGASEGLFVELHPAAHAEAP